MSLILCHLCFNKGVNKINDNEKKVHIHHEILKKLRVDQIFLFIIKTRSSRLKYADSLLCIFRLVYCPAFKKCFYVYILYHDVHIECERLKPKLLHEAVVLQ